MSTKKEGFFDWIVEFDKIEPYLHKDYIGIAEEDRKMMKVLVIGSGTSTLSYSLAEFGFGVIISVDNDKECINLMRESYLGDSRLQWYHYDVVTHESNEDESSSFHSIITTENYFDLVIDKATLDAILIEGVVHPMLSNIYRLLKSTGNYFVCTLYPEKVMYPLLSTPALGYHVTMFQTKSAITEDNFESMSGLVLVCVKKSTDFVIDQDQLMKEEEIIMNDYFRNQNPLLTIKREEEVRSVFQMTGRSSFSFTEVYDVLFADMPGLGYSLELFLDDLKDYPLAVKNQMTITEAVQFVRAMQ